MCLALASGSTLDDSDDRDVSLALVRGPDGPAVASGSTLSGSDVSMLLSVASCGSLPLRVRFSSCLLVQPALVW